MKRIAISIFISCISVMANAQVQRGILKDNRSVEMIATPQLEESNEYKGIVEKENGIIHVSEVVPVEGVGKADLYANCMAWLSEYYKNPKEVIESESEQAGIVSIQSKIVFGQYTAWEYKLSIQVKDGRYKYDFYNIYDRAYPPFEKQSRTIEEAVQNVRDWRGRIYKYFGPIIDSMKNRMKVESDW